MKTKQTQKNIPEGWEVKKLSDVLDYERPDNYIVKSTAYTDSARTPVLTANKSFIKGYTDEDFGICNNIPAIIFDDFTTDSKYVDFPFKVKSSAIKILRTKSNDSNLKFVYEKMKSIKFPIGNHKRYYISQYQDLDIAMPPLKEQRKIAEVLGAVDEDIEKTQGVIDATEKLKKGLMQQLFTRGIGHILNKSGKQKFKKTKLGKIGSFSKGKGISKKELVGEGSPAVRYGEIYTKHHFVIQKFYSFIPEEVAVQSVALKKGDILFAGSGETPTEIGKSVAYLGGEKAYVGGDIIILSPHEDDSRFLAYLLNSSFVRKELIRLSQGHTVVHIYPSFLAKITVPIPPLSEQQKIAEVLSAIDGKITANKQLKAKLTRLKKALMQDLLSGRVRVNI